VLQGETRLVEALLGYGHQLLGLAQAHRHGAQAVLRLAGARLVLLRGLPVFHRGQYA
jgi:hypothetical protein